ncbi:MAG: cytochrome c oxidase accessory protein CcoG, partial [Pseudomonadota bacterium]
WFNWGDRQAVLFDLPARKFYLFGLTFWPQDLIYLAVLLIMAALSLFLFTALAGRLWCGYACPQTVWTETFLWMERITEGNRSKRMKLDRGPWTTEKVLRKSSKQVLWVSFAFFTGFTFVSYFTPMRDLWMKLTTLSLGPWETFWIVFYSLATYGNAGFLREQVCKYMCPYARFQSAMFDRDTLIIAYDEERGEPRGGRRRGKARDETPLGDCIDCTMCVQVCPTGIDIRKGLQYECIACAACIDVCDTVMEKMDYPKGLIRYTTEHALHSEKQKIFRPRIAIYSALLLSLFAGWSISIAARTPLAVDVIRDRNALYREVPGDRIENVYTLKIMNKDSADRRYTITAMGVDGIAVETNLNNAVIPSGAIESVAAQVSVPAGSASGRNEVTIVVTADDNPEIAVRETTVFHAPF